ncbi:MAG TPA: endonuclease/exonuclease/phosphatase family protein [Methylomirabilota bacterium]
MRLPSLVFVALLAVLPLLPSAPGARPHGEPISVMSFNIRYGTAKDGENRWEARRDLLLRVVRQSDPDLLGLQEALRFQIDAILAVLPGHRLIGVGRDDGRRKGEYSALLYRASRFGVRDSGTFWFSDHPTKPGSTGWGNTIPRICSWARLRDQDGRHFAAFNLHLDHQSQPSRERSVQALAGRLAKLPAGEPAIVMGDFNAGEDNPAMAYLLGRARSAVRGPDDAPPSPWLVDTFRNQYPAASEVGTFSGFDPSRTAGPKIDYVLVDPRIHVLHAEIVRAGENGRAPSDHFPVTARLVLP